MAKLAGTIIQIRNYIDQVLRINQQMHFDDVEMNAVIQLATERLLLNISEASRRIPQSEKNKVADIPWQKIADIGNRLRHDYDNVREDTIADILQGDDLPKPRSAFDRLNPDVERVPAFRPRPRASSR